jgi:spermidine/putrescine transport system substrate-binding protein
MWGTLGIIYDPETSDTIQEDVKSWDIFWNEEYKNLISIKNSMRDTFVVGLMHAYSGSSITNKEDVLNPAREIFLQELEQASTEEEKDAARAKYNEVIQNVFDYLINVEDYQPYIDTVKAELIALKDNIFGFEVDSGKNDIITGKIKMNLAWSGDAVYSIDTAEEEADKVLEYYIPEEGSNVWYDGWALPKGANKELAMEFLNFINDPTNTATNVEYIGYTPFISSEDVFETIGSWYGIPEYYEEATYCPANEEDEVEASIVFYNDKYYTYIGEEESSGHLPTEEDYWEEMSDEDVEELGLSGNTRDLSYYFQGANEERSFVLHTFDGDDNQLECQYPTEDILARCAVMNDFQSANDDVIIMWGQLRAYTNMLPYYIILGVSAGVILAFAVTKIVAKKTSSRRKRMLAESSK